MRQLVTLSRGQRHPSIRQRWILRTQTSFGKSTHTESIAEVQHSQATPGIRKTHCNNLSLALFHFFAIHTKESNHLRIGPVAACTPGSTNLVSFPPMIRRIQGDNRFDTQFNRTLKRVIVTMHSIFLGGAYIFDSLSLRVSWDDPAFPLNMHPTGATRYHLMIC